MSEAEDTKEQGPAPRIETVRCIIEDSQGKILLLQKAKDSKAKGLFEFPGGKIDSIAGDSSTYAEQLKAVVKEIEEETGIDISRCSPQKSDEFTYQFTAGNHLHERMVHLFFVRLPIVNNEVSINSTLNPAGLSEDKHTHFNWVTKADLLRMRAEGKLSGNSQHFETILKGSSQHNNPLNPRP
ncbi:MAG: hypothetical protein A2W22_00215 [Candidatus Levybacteria bacterium RBG_16_35_11]|nr:MAG: hypothetical protein A2W22_00215 [Candidatus Levybacteria bacterium RBG_16_35_11]